MNNRLVSGRHGPALCALPLQHEAEQLLVQLDARFDDLHFRVTRRGQLVKELFFVDGGDLLVDLVEERPVRSDFSYILHQEGRTRIVVEKTTVEFGETIIVYNSDHC